MKNIKAYLKLAWALRTPFVLLLDSQYKPISEEDMREIWEELPKKPYEPELHDCDNYAFTMKGRSDEKGNAVGFVYGIYLPTRTFHAWNVVLTDKGVRQFEPQNGYLFKYGNGYVPLLAII